MSSRACLILGCLVICLALVPAVIAAARCKKNVLNKGIALCVVALAMLYAGFFFVGLGVKIDNPKDGSLTRVELSPGLYEMEPADIVNGRSVYWYVFQGHAYVDKDTHDIFCFCCGKDIHECSFWGMRSKND